MTIEIERKFMLTGRPSDDLLGPGTQIRQGYIAEEESVEQSAGTFRGQPEGKRYGHRSTVVAGVVGDFRRVAQKSCDSHHSSLG